MCMEILLGWWQGLGPGPRSPWLGIQRAGRTPRHRSLGLLCASVDSSSCFSRGSQGPTAPTGQMPASPLAGWPSTLGRAIAQPSLDSDGEGADESGDFWGSQEGCQGPFRPAGQNRGLPLRRRGGQGPHLAKRWEPRGFSRVAAGFSTLGTPLGLAQRR